MRVSSQGPSPGTFVQPNGETTAPAGVRPRAHETVETTTTTAEGVVVDMPWKADADAAIAAVEAKKGPMDDAMKAMVYADFAGRAAGEMPTAPRGAPIWKTWTPPDQEAAPAEDLDVGEPPETAVDPVDGGTVDTGGGAVELGTVVVGEPEVETSPDDFSDVTEYDLTGMIEAAANGEPDVGEILDGLEETPDGATSAA